MPLLQRIHTRARASNPRLWPSTVSILWLRANRLFPSITNATCCGIGPWRKAPIRSSRSWRIPHVTGGDEANHFRILELWKESDMLKMLLKESTTGRFGVESERVRGAWNGVYIVLWVRTVEISPRMLVVSGGSRLRCPLTCVCNLYQMLGNAGLYLKQEAKRRLPLTRNQEPAEASLPQQTYYLSKVRP